MNKKDLIEISNLIWKTYCKLGYDKKDKSFEVEISLLHCIVSDFFREVVRKDKKEICFEFLYPKSQNMRKQICNIKKCNLYDFNYDINNIIDYYLDNKINKKVIKCIKPCGYVIELANLLIRILNLVKRKELILEFIKEVKEDNNGIEVGLDLSFKNILLEDCCAYLHNYISILLKYKGKNLIPFLHIYYFIVYICNKFNIDLKKYIIIQDKYNQVKGIK